VASVVSMRISPSLRTNLLRTTAVASAACLLAGLLGSASAPAEASAPRPGGAPVPLLSWQPCSGGFQCATARVPLDYRHPRGAAISIAVIRHLATDPRHALGSLFINGGGPNPQIAGFPAAYLDFPAALRARYNLITFDPRGFGYSSDIRCFPNPRAEQKLVGGLPPFPAGARQVAAWQHTWARFDARCARRAGPLLDHDSTADVARDMNLLRQAVGDPVLNYYGASYGTLLGATYANLFPGTAGRMILDGNLNPAGWTRPEGPLTNWQRIGRDQASAATLRAFLDLCGRAGTARCAFAAGSPAATRAKFAALLRRLRRHPVTAGSPPRTYTYAGTVASVPVGVVSGWPCGARLLQALWAGRGRLCPPGAAAPAAAARAAGRPAAAGPFHGAYYGEEEQLAVLCADSPNPRDPRLYPLLAALSYRQSGGYGPDYTWNSEQCARWPAGAAQDRYTGPWNRHTAGTILLLGNTGDPDTPYQDSVALARELARARLLTIDGYGHTEGSNPSTCATDDAVRYALTGALPPAGTVCQQDGKPFPG
jgi:pimeloyl-ACP methyl ester carboxylesterase